MDFTALSPDELVATCLGNSDEAAWTEFVRRFHPLISRVVLRIARQWGDISSETIDDLIQETYLKLCAQSGHSSKFTASHPDAIFAYIKVFTANLVHDHFKACHSKKRGGSVATTSIENEDHIVEARSPQSAHMLIERSVLIQEIDACIQTICIGPNTERDRRIFWLYYRVGLSAAAIASLPTIDLSIKGVESTILRVTRLVRQRLVAPKVRGSSNISKGIRLENSL